MSSSIVFPREGQGVRAEMRIGDVLHLVLMSVHSAGGPIASVYDAKTKKWVFREWAEDIDDGKRKAIPKRNWRAMPAKLLTESARPENRFPPLSGMRPAKRVASCETTSQGRPGFRGGILWQCAWPTFGIIEILPVSLSRLLSSPSPKAHHPSSLRTA